MFKKSNDANFQVMKNFKFTIKIFKSILPIKIYRLAFYSYFEELNKITLHFFLILSVEFSF